MKINIFLLFSLSILLASCEDEEQKTTETPATPLVRDNGNSIIFPDIETIAFFKTEKIHRKPAETELTAPGKVVATVVPSTQGASQNIILFDNPELTGNYTQLIQHQINIAQIQNINIRQKQLELERTRDLLSHGSATGQDLLNAQTALSMEQTSLENEKAALIEHESRLKAAGFNPETVRKADAGIAYIICDIPENQIGEIREGQSCHIAFAAFPNEKFTGITDAVTDRIDNITRMAKVRISIQNASNKFRSGMFVHVSFALQTGNALSVHKTSLVTVQGRHYVFVKKSINAFERSEVRIGQQTGDRIRILSGLQDHEEIAVGGVMQLKGLSFGY